MKVSVTVEARLSSVGCAPHTRFLEPWEAKDVLQRWADWMKRWERWKPRRAWIRVGDVEWKWVRSGD
jgi:hypothetical protein